MLNYKSIDKGLKDENITINVEGKNYIFRQTSNYIDVTINKELKVYTEEILDVSKKNNFKELIIPDTGYILRKNTLYLGRTNEYNFSKGCVPFLAGLDEWAAMGMEIHVTAGFGDNGFEGTWTLEIVTTNDIKIYPNMVIGKLYFYELIGEQTLVYDGKYKGQIKPGESQLNKEYNIKNIEDKKIMAKKLK